MPTDTAGSVTVMIRLLRAGDRAQVPALWERYFEQLTRLAHPIVKFGPTAARLSAASPVFGTGAPGCRS